MITSMDALVSAMGNNSSRFTLYKSSTSGQTAGAYASLWRVSGQPGPGPYPSSTPTVRSSATVGCLGFAQQIEPAASYLAIIEGSCSVANQTLEIHDRLADVGALVANITTAQTVGLDLSTMLETFNLAERIGDANYSDVQWWLEWSITTGTTSSNIVINVTYDDGSTGNLTSLALPASRGAGHAILINSLIPASDAGKFIRGVNEVTLSASTGTDAK